MSPLAALCRGWIWNLLGQALPLVVSLVAAPYTIAGLGAVRYGILALLWVVLGYAGLMDFGASKALTRLVAQGTTSTPPLPLTQLLQSMALLFVLLALAAAAAVWSLAPWLTASWFQIPPAYEAEACGAFRIGAVGLVITFLCPAAIAVLEGLQAFRVVNLVRMPAAIVGSLIPVAGVHWQWSLPAIVAGLVAKDGIALCCYIALARGELAGRVLHVRWPWAAVGHTLRGVLKESYWLGLHSTATLVLWHADRLLIGRLLGIASLTLYTVAAELLNKALIVPTSLMITAFPAFSSERQTAAESGKVLLGAWRLLSLAMIVITVAAWFGAHPLLRFWLGAAYIPSVTVVRLLTLTLFFSALAWLLGTWLQGQGYARLVTGIHLAQVPLHLACAWALTRAAGLEGAALSSCARVLLSLGLLAAAARVTKGFPGLRALGPDFGWPRVALSRLRLF